MFGSISSRPAKGVAMAEQLSEEEMRAWAEKRVEEKIGFRNHLIVYLIVNTILFLIWLFTSLFAANGWIFPWFLFPLGGWGIGIAFHAWNVYGAAGSYRRREALIQKEMERIGKGPGEPGS